MTRIILLLDPEPIMTYIIDDPRSMRELVKLINTEQLVVGAGELRMEGQHQWAMAIEPLNVVTVVLESPPVNLSPRLYDVLYGLADGKRAEAIAAELDISRRTVYEYISELKERLGANTRWEVIFKAVDLGLLRDEYYLCLRRAFDEPMNQSDTLLLAEDETGPTE